MIAPAGYAPRLLHRRDLLRAYFAPFLFAPGIYYQSGRVIRRRSSSNFFRRLLSTAVSRKRACYAANEKPPVIATGHLTTVGASETMRLRRHLYRYALDAFSGSSPADYIAWTRSPRAMYSARSISARHTSPQLCGECGKSKCVHLVTFDDMRNTERSQHPRDSTVGGLKATRRDAEQRTWRGVDDIPLAG